MGLQITSTDGVCPAHDPTHYSTQFTNTHPRNAKCYSSQIFKSIGVFNSSINIATDLIFALVPIPMVWKLQVTVQTRIGLAVILSLGLFASAVAIYKTPMQYNFFKVTDWSGAGAWYYIWQEYVIFLPPYGTRTNVNGLFACQGRNVRGHHRSLPSHTQTPLCELLRPSAFSGYKRPHTQLQWRGQYPVPLKWIRQAQCQSIGQQLRFEEHV